jgi:hypothetical protein
MDERQKSSSGKVVRPAVEARCRARSTARRALQTPPSAAPRALMSERSSHENVVVSHGIEDYKLADLEQRAALAFAVAPTPWIAQLETRQPIGGESFIRLGDDPDLDQELYIRLYMGPNEIASPDVGLDAVVDFIVEAAQAIPRLIAEIRRLRSL